MATQADLTARLAALRATLSDAKNPDGSPIFSGFRPPEPCAFCGGTAQPPPGGVNEDCEDCDDTGLQGGAGGLEDGLAGLPDAWSRTRVMSLLISRINQIDEPDRDTILLKGLELVCEAAGLEVLDD